MYSQKEIIEILGLIAKRLHRSGDETAAEILEIVTKQLEEKIK